LFLPRDPQVKQVHDVVPLEQNQNYEKTVPHEEFLAAFCKRAATPVSRGETPDFDRANLCKFLSSIGLFAGLFFIGPD
jgi:hypothetical protein